MSLSPDLEERLQQLHTAVISDVADEMGLYNTALPLELRPLWTQRTVVGTAHTIQMVDVAYHTDDHFDRILESMASVDSGDIVVRAAPADVRAGIWGELLSTAARSLGAKAAVVDGPTRDARLIKDVEFPVWAKGHSPLDGDGRCDVKDHSIPIEVGGVTIQPGDVIVADYEGIVRLPTDAVEEITERAEEELATENDFVADLQDDGSFEEAYREHQTL